jgi:plasmid stabilization system protein ParE
VNPYFVLSPRAAEDLVEIWHFVKTQSSLEIAERVYKNISGKFLFLASNPGVGHRRENLTGKNVRFFAVYSYLIVYRVQTGFIEIASVLHGRRDIELILRDRL